ncbi:MAG: FAD-dependent oxidoreductase, partial [Acidimicrobiales bacterium]
PALPPVPGLDALGPLTSETVFERRDRPASMAVVGGGAVGVELAQAFARLGVAVSLLEARSRVLAGEEPEASAVVEAALTGAGVSLHTGTSVVSAGRRGGGRDGVELEVDTGGSRRRIDADVLLIAAGRAPDLAGLDLEAAGVECGPGGWVRVGPGLRTSARSIWAVGDVCGLLQLTHAADQMGRLAVGNALSHRPERRFRPEMIPRVVYTDPEVASVGMATAAVAGRRGRTEHLSMAEVDRARTAARTEGFLQLSVGPRRVLGNLAGGKVLGATIVAPRAGEMIAEIALAMRAGLFPAQLALTSHAYPTWSVAIQQAAAQIFAR